MTQAPDEVWTIFIIPSSHNDIGWAGTPAEMADHRAQIIDTALEGMEKYPDYRFVMEAGLYFREYRDRRAQGATLLKQRIDEGRFEWGGAYVQAYEGILTDEGLLRQLYLGRGWMLRELGVNVGSYWHIDVVARTLQLPQVLSHAGFRYLVLSRNKPGLYWWEAPDGSRILTFSYWEGAYGRSKVFDTLKRHYSPLQLFTPSPPSWLADPGWAMPAVIIAGVWKGFPFYMLMLLAGLQTIPTELLEAAHLDGATFWQSLRYVMLPLLRPVITTSLMLGVIWTSNYFDGIYLMTQGGPAEATQTLPIWIYNVAFSQFDLNRAATISVVLLVIVLGLLILYFRGKGEEL